MKWKSALTIDSLDVCVADTMPITARATVRWLSFRPIQTRISSAWRNRRTTPGRAAHLGNCPKSQCCISTMNTKSCSRDYRAWSSRNAAAHSPPSFLAERKWRKTSGRRRESRTDTAILSLWSISMIIVSLSSSIVVDCRRRVLGDSSSDRLKVPCSESDCVMRISLEREGRNTKCAGRRWLCVVIRESPLEETVLDAKGSPKRDSRRVRGTSTVVHGPWQGG